MGTLSKPGRIFYGAAIAEMGLQTIYCRNFPYMLLPPTHFGEPWSAYILGILLALTGGFIVFEKMTRQISLLFGALLLLIFCFCFIPYELMATSNYMHFGEWENAAKELTLAGGAFVIAGCYQGKNENSTIMFPGKLIPFGAALFPLMIISFGIDHFLYAKQAANYVPSWVPYHLFWMYFCGIALLGSGIAIVLKIRTRLIATLLGAMIFTWFISLHIPRVIVSSAADLPDELTSAFLALAYCGIAFVIAGTAKKAAHSA